MSALEPHSSTESGCNWKCDSLQVPLFDEMQMSNHGSFWSAATCRRFRFGAGAIAATSRRTPCRTPYLSVSCAYPRRKSSRTFNRTHGDHGGLICSVVNEWSGNGIAAFEVTV